MLISEKAEFKLTHVRREKNYFTWYRNSTNQKNITILNIYSLNTSTLNFRKQTLLDVKWQVKPKKNDLWFYYHTTINRWDIQVKNKYRQSESNDTIDQKNLTDI